MNMFRYIKDLIAFQSLPKSERRIVFYSEGPHDWIHLSGLIKDILLSPDISVAYISSRSDDPGLQFHHPHCTSYQTDSSHIRNWLFENIDTPLLVLTTPDLHQYQLKKSKHKVRYVYIQHSLVSLHMAYRQGAFDHFDDIFCAGPHHVKEIKAMESAYHLPAKNIFEHGYGRLDNLIEARNIHAPNKTPAVVIAPSWGENTIIHTIGEHLIQTLLESDFNVTLRPHPQTLKLSKTIIDRMTAVFKTNPRFTLETDMNNRTTFEKADIMISDWSGAAIEFAFAYSKPVIFIDLPRKINNPNYNELMIEPFEVQCRTHIGNVVSTDDISTIGHVIKETLHVQKDDIHSFYAENVFNLGAANKLGARRLIQLLMEQANK